MSKKPLEKQKEKISSELVTLTYGVMVQQLIKDSETIQEANTKIEKMGFNIGCRLIDDFLSKHVQKPCKNFKEIAEIISKNGMEVYLGVKSEIFNFTQLEKTATFSLILQENPLNDYVELPEELQQLEYSNILCGVIRGAMNMVKADCKVVKDPIKGDDKTEIFVTMSKDSLTKE